MMPHAQSVQSNLIKIVLLTDCLVDYAGGAEKQIYELAKRLDKSRFEVIVVSLDCEGKASKETIEALGCRLIVFKVVRIYGFSGWINGIRFKKFLQKEQVHILQTYHFSSDIWGTFWGHLAKVPYIVSNRRDMGFWRKGIHLKAYRLLNRWVNQIVVVSQSVKEMVQSTEGVHEDKIKIIYNGIALERVPPTNEKTLKFKEHLQIQPHHLVILHVATLKPIKGHEFLLKAVADLVPRYPHLKLILVGEDRMAGQLQKLAQQLDIEHQVLFLGKRTDVSDIIPIADICVMPSLSEGLSNSILEYMLFAKPVVATSVGGNPEIIQHGYTGFIVPPKSSLDLSDALYKLVEDENKRRIFGENGRKRVEDSFSINQMINIYEDFFSSYQQKNQPLRVLHLVSSIGLFGAERVILNLASYQEGISPIVGALYNHHNPHIEIIDEASRMGLKTAVFDSKGQFDWKTIWHVKKFLVENDIDILHTHNYKSDIIGFFSARLAKKKWFATNHVWHSTDAKMVFYEKIDAFILKSARCVMGVSDEIKNDLMKRGIKRAHVIHNGIDVNKFAQHQLSSLVRQSFGFSSSDIVISIVGRLSKEKGHKIFIQAAQDVLLNHKNARFLIVGDGPLKTELQEDILQRSLQDKIILAGIRQDMPDIYTMSDILVNASYIEGLPMTILEAMASKLAIIATKVGAVPQVIVNHKNGLLIEAGDVQSLIRHINYLIENPQQRRSMVLQAFIDVNEQFSMRRMAERYKEIYLNS